MKNLQLKKSLVLPIVALCLFITLGTQAQGLKKITFGIKSGVSYSTIGNGFKCFSNKIGDVGYSIGGFARTTDRLYIQPELNFIALTNEYKTDLRKYKEKSQLINVPILIGYRVWSKDKFGIRVAGGPDFSYNLKKTVKDGLADTRFNYGAIASVGVDYGKFSLESKYSIGLKDINKTLDKSLNVYSLGIAYKFL